MWIELFVAASVGVAIVKNWAAVGACLDSLGAGWQLCATACAFGFRLLSRQVRRGCAAMYEQLAGPPPVPMPPPVTDMVLPPRFGVRPPLPLPLPLPALPVPAPAPTPHLGVAKSPDTLTLGRAEVNESKVASDVGAHASALRDDAIEYRSR